MKAFRYELHEWDGELWLTTVTRYFTTLEKAKQTALEHVITTDESYILEWKFDAPSKEHFLKLNSYHYYAAEIEIEE